MSAQTDYPFPWNPDADLDGWVSTSDLLSLLTVFDSEFNPTAWETDSLNAAVVLDGAHSYFACQNHCHQIEGHWKMADLDAFGRHYGLVEGTPNFFWVNSNKMLEQTTNPSWGGWGYQLYGGTGQLSEIDENDFAVGRKCLCYIQSSPFVPSQYAEELNPQFLGLLSDLQEQVNTLQTALDSLQSFGAVIDSISSLSSQYGFECVEMGVAPLCSAGSGFNTELNPADGYNYPVARNGSSEVTLDLVSPTWRKFRIGGIDSDITSAIIVFKGKTEDGNVSASQHDISVVDGKIEFFVYGKTSGCPSDCTYCTQNYMGMFDDEVALNVNSYHVHGCYCESSLSHIEISLNIDGQMIDTNIRFNPFNP